MNSKGRELMAALTSYIADRWQLSVEGYGKPPRVWKGWPLLYSGYCSDREGCTREGGVFGDMANLESEIIDMFGAYYMTIRNVILIEMGKSLSECMVDVTVEPSWQDASAALVTYKGNILIRNDCKAWNFSWETPDEMAESMLEDYEEIKANLQKALSAGSAQKAYVVISVYKGIIQGDDGVHVTFSKDKADELRAAADKEMGIERDADGRYDSDNDVYCIETDIEQ